MDFLGKSLSYLIRAQSMSAPSYDGIKVLLTSHMYGLQRETVVQKIDAHQMEILDLCWEIL